MVCALVKDLSFQCAHLGSEDPFFFFYAIHFQKMVGSHMLTLRYKCVDIYIYIIKTFDVYE